jgi:hypothetical protein
MRQPVFNARMRFSAMLAHVVLPDEPLQPAIGLRVRLRLMEMVKGFVGFLDGAEGALDFALGARRRAASVFAGGEVRQDGNAEMFHHTTKHAAFCDRTVVAVDRRGDTLKRRIIFVRLGSHRVE